MLEDATSEISTRIYSRPALHLFKRASVILGQTVVVILITFILAEIALRIYHQINPTFIFYSSSYNRYRGKPFAPEYDFHLNSKGFKDVEFSAQKPEGTFRILAIGDSFAYGVVPYRYNYLTLLEERLNENERKVEVINMGIPGTGPRDYLSLLVHEGLVLRPDMVIISFFIGNDFERKKKRKLYTYSYLASFIKYLIDRNTKFEGQIVHGSAAYDDNSSNFDDEAYLELERSRSYIFIQHNKNLEKGFAGSMSHVSQIRDICSRHKIGLLIVIIPDELQVNIALQQKIIEASGQNPGEFDFTLPNRMLAERFRTEGITYIDLLDEFVAAASTVNLYKLNDSHWNIAGNKLASEIIREHLVTRLH